LTKEVQDLSNKIKERDHFLTVLEQTKKGQEEKIESDKIFIQQLVNEINVLKNDNR
jgi:hypothetical protein